MQIEKIDIRPVTIPTGKTYSEIRRAYREFHKGTRVYVFPKGETVWENLEKRRQRPHTTFRKEVMPKVLAEMGLPADTRFRWSQYAGCSCPCSPGFIIEGVTGKTVYVDVTL